MYPQRFIYFDVLHGIAAMLPIVRLTAGWGRPLWILGIATIATKSIAAYVHLAGASIGFLAKTRLAGWAWQAANRLPKILSRYFPGWALWRRAWRQGTGRCAIGGTGSV